LRLLSEPSAGPEPSPLPRFLRPSFEAEDDRGNRFTVRPYFGSGGAGRQRRYVYHFTPQLDRSAHELRLRCTDLRREDPGGAGDEEAVLGPCSFSIPLGQRPPGEEAPPDDR
ncbi:MAG TPA: hypothetical protein VK821_02360, partial [Dehalococcoidia bacterium]|nr:hypothetical protein [Dehalococcoidia bacterium]